MNIKELSNIVTKCLAVENLDELEKQAINVDKALSELSLEENFKECVGLLDRQLFRPFCDKIFQLGIPSPPLDDRIRRIARQKERELLRMKAFLEDFQERIFNDFSTVLQESSYYKKYSTALINKLATQRDYLINPYYEDYPIEVLSPQHFEELLQEAYSKTVQYFKMASDSTKNKDKFEQELHYYMCEVQNKIILVNSAIDSTLNNIKSEESKDEKLYKGIYEEEHSDEGGWKTDLEEEHNQRLIELRNKHERLNRHLKILKQTEQHFQQSYLFLQKYKQNTVAPLTVFGNSDLELVKSLYNEMSPFLNTSTKEQDFIKTFIDDDELPAVKIDFANVNNNNFVALITEMKPFFVKHISKKGYNDWWANRFTFNDVIKSSEAISTMRSNTKKQGDRKPDSPTVIKNVVVFLSKTLK